MTEISTGMICPICFEVLALYCLQNSMMFRPAAPRAGPTGGDGFALPASIESLITCETAAQTCC